MIEGLQMIVRQDLVKLCTGHDRPPRRDFNRPRTPQNGRGDERFYFLSVVKNLISECPNTVQYLTLEHFYDSRETIPKSAYSISTSTSLSRANSQSWEASRDQLLLV